MAVNATKKKSSHTTDNDIYTALLGLTVLVLAATATFVCLRSLELYETLL